MAASRTSASLSAGSSFFVSTIRPNRTCRARLRKQSRKDVFSPSPALDELFLCLDQSTVDADLFAHVREYLQGQQRGVKRTYRALRRA